MANRLPEGPVALVLAGGGARAAYEAGALAELLPVLEERGQPVEIVVGTSAGAINAAFLAANLHRTAAEIAEEAQRVWRSLTWGDVLAPLWGPASLTRIARYAAQVGGLPRIELDSLLDPSPLRSTLRRLVALDQVERNLEAGRLRTAAVVATANASGWSVVFHAGGDPRPLDQARAIEYVATPLHVDHLVASAAIPTVFPAVHITEPAAAEGWYRDGGTRLNTPIRPAIKLGAKRVVVIGLHAIGPPPGPLAAGPRPDAFSGAAHILQGLLADPLANDICTLAGTNDLLGRIEPPFPGPPFLIPYIFVAPFNGTVGRLAVEVFREVYAGQPHRSPSLAILERLIDGSADEQHGELLSHLFFAPEFADVLLAMGRDDARRWLSSAHDDGPWHLGPLPGHEDALEPEAGRH